ncbi:MAG: hypothetical protein Q8N59_02010, partial [bacterium]|nr:hypothetical protein [bacterium]
MKKSITKKKFLIIIAVILFLGITVPQIASAQSLAEFVKDPGRSIVRACTEWLLAILRWTVDTAADFFEAMLDLGFQGHQKIAKVGWDVSRDIANMCFILFMVIIAFATILRFERYGIKELLPKVIMIALLINFSMVICYVIIDFTNIIANFFITDAKNAVPNPPGQEGINISAILTDGFKLPELYTPFLCQQFVDDQEKCATLTPESAANNCMAQAERGLNECYQTDARNTQTEATNFWDALAAAFGTAIILAVATFVYLAGGVLLVGRLIIIWFLVMIAPLAFICYILPALRKNWQAWWSLFIKWCIFAPAYSFFIWLTCKIVLEDKLNNIAALKVSMSSKSGEAVNTFFASTGSLLHFLFVCGLLLGGLIASSQMGIRGASIAMTLGKKWTGATKGWIKKQTVGRAKERAEGGLDRARGGIMSGAGKLFGDTKIGRNLRARGTMAQQAAAGREYNKKYAARLSMMSREDTLKEVEKASGTQKLLAARTAQNRGYMREATNEQAQAAMKAYETFGDSEMLRKLEELRPDA